MIDNLIGRAGVFDRAVKRNDRRGFIALAAEVLCHADMGAAAAQRHMPEAYHKIVAAARRWLRNQDAALA